MVVIGGKNRSVWGGSYRSCGEKYRTLWENDRTASVRKVRWFSPKILKHQGENNRSPLKFPSKYDLIKDKSHLSGRHLLSKLCVYHLPLGLTLEYLKKKGVRVMHLFIM